MRFVGLSVFLMFISVLLAHAQEGMPGNELQDLNTHPELNLNDDKVLIYEPDRTGGSTEKMIQSKEQLIAAPKSVKPKTSDSSKAPTAKSEEDALSFNFLYYLIQKFKISDIVEP